MDEAFLETVAQIGVVVALTAVIEARFAVKSWRTETPQIYRIAQALFFALAIVAIGASTFAALYLLGGGAAESIYFSIMGIGLGIGIGVTVLAPVIRMLFAAFALQIVKVIGSGRAQLEDEALAVMERVAHEHLAQQLDTVALMLDMRKTARRALKRARAGEADASQIRLLKKNLKSRDRDVERYFRLLSRGNDLVDRAGDTAQKVKTARDKTNRAEADLIVDQERGVFPSP